MTVSPLFWPRESILVILLSLYGIRLDFELMASTHLAKVKSLLLMLADSTILSLPFSVLRLSSDPARSIAEAVLILISFSVVTVSFIASTACDLEEAALSYSSQ